MQQIKIMDLSYVNLEYANGLLELDKGYIEKLCVTDSMLNNLKKRYDCKRSRKTDTKLFNREKYVLQHIILNVYWKLGVKLKNT